MRTKHSQQVDEPPLGPLVRGFIGLGIAFGGGALGGDVGLGLLLIGMSTIASGGVLFAIESLAHWKRRRE